MKRNRNLFMITAVLGAALIVLLVSGSAWANYADSVGMSAAGIARGNAMTAVASDWSSVYYNIAGLGRSRASMAEWKKKENDENGMSLKLRTKKNDGDSNEKPKDVIYGSQVGFNYLYAYPRLNITIPKYVTSQKDQNFGVITVGLTLDIDRIFDMPDFISSTRFGLSLGLMQDGTLVKINDLDPTTHSFAQYGREAQRTVILAGLGIGFLNDAFGIGGGANVLLGGTGKISLTDIMALSEDLQMPQQDVQLDVKTKIAPVAGIYFSPGRLWSPLKGLTIGASYRGEVYVDIPIFTHAVVDTLGIPINMLIRVLTYYTPHIFNGGIAYTVPVKHLEFTISADVEYQMWSRQIFKNMGLLYSEMPRFQDIIVPKAGLHYKIIREAGLSVGYYWEPSYIPDKALYGDLNTLDNEKHVFSAGAEFIIPRMWRMKGEIQINIGYQYQMLVRRRVIKVPDLLKNPSLNPSYSFGGDVHSASVELIVKW